jgi:TPR repeat protein
MRHYAHVLLSIVLLVAGPSGATERVALVIGNGDYRSIVKLDNPVNDARGVASTLRGIGFDVTEVMEGTAETIRSALDDFSFRAETADLALIYYAGHGVEVQGENYLIPVDAQIASNRDVQRQAISLDRMLAAVDRARRMRVVILDSCRDNPFGDALDFAVQQQDAAATEATRSAGTGGLAPAEPDRGTLVAFAARDGQVALDGTGAHSPFATALIDNLPTPGIDISMMFRRIRDEVVKTTFARQEPYTYGSLSGTPFYVAGPADGDSTVAAADPRVAWSDIGPDLEPQLVSLADQGDTRSMVGLAYMRLNAADPRYSPADAARLLTRAAEDGAPEAQYELGKLYESGLGVDQDVARALDLYRLSASQNFADALNDLGFLYYQGGLGVVRDPTLALAFFERAARARHPEAMFNFAALIDDGIVPGMGPDEAAGFLYLALRSGNQTIFDMLRDRPTMWKLPTRQALQQQLSQRSFYTGPIDGDFGPATQAGIKAAYGIS